jgi:6-oxo-cyclohex-1-ene-carbonyl-CoA hydrolase
MSLEWLPRDDAIKNHALFGSEHWGTAPPCAMYEKRPVRDERGQPVVGLYVAWITLNNPDQFNSYTTEMVKGVIAGFQAASSDRSVVAAVFTAVGDKAFCTGATRRSTPSTTASGPTSMASTWTCSTGWSTPF